MEVCTFASWALAPRRRKNAAANMAMAGAPATRSAVYRVFRLQTTNIYELFASSRWENEAFERLFEFEGRAELDRALATGRGVILVTGHVGSFELGARYLQSLGYRLHVVAGVQLNRFLTGAVKEAKERHGIEVINPENSHRKILKVFQSNGTLALLADGDVFSGGVERPFFGKTARVPDGPARLAKAAGAPIIGGWCRRAGKKRFVINLETVADEREVESLGEEELLARVYAALERFIAANADQWCMFRRIWEREA